MYKIYLAGPFFNPIQEEHAKRLARTLEMRGYEIFAPVQQPWKEGSIISPEYIFKRNLLWMQECNFALCQLDYPMLSYQTLCICEENQEEPEEENWHKVIQLPDAGTVWEMGYLYALHKCIIGYCAEKTDSINLMLAQCLTGYVKDPLEFFKQNEINWAYYHKWKGKQV